jgi:hypothetical protein
MSVAFDALKWIADTLLNRKKEKTTIKKEKWNQVSDYLNQISQTIDLSISDFKANKIPHGHYSLLYNLGGDFENVLWQIYDYDKDYFTVRQFRKEFEKAVHLVEEGDAVVLEATSIETKSGKIVLEDLEACAGKFKALSVTLKALA